MKKLKNDGKTVTVHTKEIPKLALVKMFRMLVTLHRLMTVDKNGQEYAVLVTQLPPEWQDKYHVLLQWGIMFILALHYCRRAREGIDSLTKDHIEKQQDEESGQYFWTKVKDEVSKNHQQDDQNLAFGGVILFAESMEGLNPGQFIEDYIKTLNDGNAYLFQRAKRPSKDFNIHSPDTKVNIRNFKKRSEHYVKK
jgi:hypothetical protein